MSVDAHWRLRFPAPGNPDSQRLRADIDKYEYPVHCHVCPPLPDGRLDPMTGGRLPSIPRSRARQIGDTRFGGLWHCEAHQHGRECNCPFGDWTDAPMVPLPVPGVDGCPDCRPTWRCQAHVLP